MTRYYYSIEDDKVYSLDDIRSFYEISKENGNTYALYGFDNYLQNCMYYHNGDLMPIVDRIFELKRKIARLERAGYIHSKCNGIIRSDISEEYKEQIKEVEEKIKELEKYW